MSKLNLSMSTQYIRLIILMFLLIACISANKIDSIINNPDEEYKDIFIPDNAHLWKHLDTRSDHSIMGSDYDLSYGSIRIIPYKKRTIPIELQKALYAHGIVGRRRRR